MSVHQGPAERQGTKDTRDPEVPTVLTGSSLHPFTLFQSLVCKSSYCRLKIRSHCLCVVLSKGGGVVVLE